jgi:hypothetical protein
MLAQPWRPIRQRCEHVTAALRILHGIRVVDRPHSRFGRDVYRIGLDLPTSPVNVVRSDLKGLLFAGKRALWLKAYRRSNCAMIRQQYR